MHGSQLSLCHKEPERSKPKRSKAPSRGLWMPDLVLHGKRLLAQASPGKLWTNESAVMKDLDQWELTSLIRSGGTGGGQRHLAENITTKHHCLHGHVLPPLLPSQQQQQHQ